MDDRHSALTEEEWAIRRSKRLENRRRKLRARRRARLRMAARCITAVILLALLWGVVRMMGNSDIGTAQAAEIDSVEDVLNEPAVSAPQELLPYAVSETADTVAIGDEVASSYAIFIDLSNGTICGEKNGQTEISPASMTKILTVLVAAEQIDNLDDTVSVPIEATDECYLNDCTAAGFLSGEVVTVRDLFYGTILPSGADAALSLALYTAGSQEAFVALMNEKAAELGLSEAAHFTNCVGIYNAEHLCTVEDIALILKAAEENDFCREVLSAHTYTTSKTEQHPDGILLSNWFLRRIEDKDTAGMTVLCAKTGFVTQSGSCAASYAVDAAGNDYICVTGNAVSSWRCIYDHVALYQKFGSNG